MIKRSKILLPTVCTLLLGCLLGALLHGGAAKKTQALTNENTIDITSTNSYSIFNSGLDDGFDVEIDKIPPDYSAGDSDSTGTHTNGNHDIYAYYFDSRFPYVPVQIGRSFTVCANVTERVCFTIKTFGELNRQNTSHCFYLIDKTDESVEPVALGAATGFRYRWSTTTFEVDAKHFVNGHEYILQLKLSTLGEDLWIRSVSMIVTTQGSQTPSHDSPVVYSAITAQIDENGGVSADLTVFTLKKEILGVEMKLSLPSNADQPCVTEYFLIETSSEGSKTTLSVRLPEEALAGNYYVQAFLKNKKGETLGAPSCMASFNPSVKTQYYAVTYHANGGSNCLPRDPESYREGKSVPVKFDYRPSREGYLFLGWATSPSAQTPEFTQKGTRSFPMGKSDVTLYAIWAQRSEDSEIDGWAEINGNRYYMLNGEYATGLTVIEDEIHEFSNDGVWLKRLTGTRLVQISSDYYYLLNSKLTTGLHVVDYRLYEFSPQYVSNGAEEGTRWITINNDTYYLDEGKIATGYHAVNDRLYLFGSDGALKGQISGTQLLFSEGRYYYVYDGKLATGLQVIDRHVYIFSDQGVAKHYETGTKLVEYGEKAAYIVDGEAQTGDFILRRRVYRFGADGTCNGAEQGSKWITVGENKYFLDEDILFSGYKAIDGYLYFFNDDGVCEGYRKGTGFFEVGDRNYYLLDDRVCVGECVIQGRVYRFDEEGVLQTIVNQTGIYQIGENVYYLIDGLAVKGIQAVEKRLYLFNDLGVMQEQLQGTRLVNSNDGLCYLIDGELATGYHVVDRRIYYFGADGILASDGVHSANSLGYLSGDQAFLKVDENVYYLLNDCVYEGYLSHQGTLYFCGNGKISEVNRDFEGAILSDRDVTIKFDAFDENILEEKCSFMAIVEENKRLNDIVKLNLHQLELENVVIYNLSLRTSYGSLVDNLRAEISLPLPTNGGERLTGYWINEGEASLEKLSTLEIIDGKANFLTTRLGYFALVVEKEAPLPSAEKPASSTTAFLAVLIAIPSVLLLGGGVTATVILVKRKRTKSNGDFNDRDENDDLFDK